MGGRTTLSLLVMVFALSCGCSASDSQVFRNDTGVAATGLRVVFDHLVEITSHSFTFSAMNPWGSAREFVFSSGHLRPGGEFAITWTSLAYAHVVSFEWLTGGQVIPPSPTAPVSATPVPAGPVASFRPAERCSVTVSASAPDLREAISGAYSSTPDEPVVCIEPGIYDIEGYLFCSRNITLRGAGQTASQVVITCSRDQQAEIASAGQAVVVLENLELRYADVGAYQSSRLILRNAIAGTIYASEKADIEIESSLLRQAEGDVGGLEGVIVDGEAGVSIRRSVVEWLVSVGLDGRLSVVESVFQGRASRLLASDRAKLEIRGCTFDPVSGGILLSANFNGEVLGEGNSIPRFALQPASYSWPVGFVR